MKASTRPATAGENTVTTPRPGSTRFCPALRLSEIKAFGNSTHFTADDLIHSHPRVGKLLVRSRSGAAQTFREGFEMFRDGFQAANNQDTQKFRIATFYDNKIIPDGTRLATPRSMRPITGNSPLEIIFDYFCSRQQPGTG